MDLSISAATLVTIFVSLVIAISLHEMMHALTSYWLGDTTAQEQGRISLNPLRHIDPFLTIVLPIITLVLFHMPVLAAKPVPFNPERVKFEEFGAALVALAGPLTNLVLAAATAMLLHIGSWPLALSDTLKVFTQINVALFVFNMVPIPPLDGSRVLFAVAPEAVQAVMLQLEQLGFIIIFGLILVVPAFGQILSQIDNSIIQFLLQSV